jgi:4-amino-4-deoxy-L-arabinose transferase-like glycosyltransferase
VGIAAFVGSRWTVPTAAAAAFLLRVPGLGRPVRPDEAGWFLVARSWDPSEESVYGPHFLDRPPSLIALVDLADALGGPTALRLLGALAAASMVLLAARIGALVADETAGRWSAVVVLALTTSPLIDPVAAKGEVLALPLVGLAMLWALQAVLDRRPWPGVAFAFASGVAGAAALGFKQSLAGGLVFATALFLASWRWGPVTGHRVVALVAAALLGALVPVLATVAWAASAGVRLSVLWYAVYGFRLDAAGVLAEGHSDAQSARLALLVLVALASGLVTILGGFVVHFPLQWSHNRPVALATGAVVIAQLAGLAAGGNYWRPYLLALIPVTALCVTLLMEVGGRVARRTRAVVVFAVGSAALSLVVWWVLEVAGRIAYTEVAAGAAVDSASDPGDSLVVFGGRADLQYASGLPSPYPHLWSLPMRTLDPEYDELVALLEGPRAPTWFVTWVPLTSWHGHGADDLRRAIHANYDRHGASCEGKAIYLLEDVQRPRLQLACRRRGPGQATPVAFSRELSSSSRWVSRRCRWGTLRRQPVSPKPMSSA